MRYRSLLGIWLPLFLALGIAVAGVTAVYLLLQTGRHDVLWVDMAGRQRMLAEQSLAHWQRYVHEGSKAAKRAALAASREYEQGLALLSDGGPARGRVLPPSPPAVREPLDRLRSLWQSHAQAARTIVDHGPSGKRAQAALARMGREHDALVEAADDMVRAFSQRAKDRRYGVVMWMALALAAVLLTGAFGIAALQRQRSERAQAERSVQERDRLLRQFAETADQVYCFRDVRPERTVYVSPAYETIWGRALQGMYDDPRDFIKGIHPDDYERISNALAAEDTTGAFDEEYRIVRPNGEVRWIHDRHCPLHDDEGRVCHVAGLAEDVTERKHAEQARLREVREQRDALVREVHHRIKNHLQGLSGLLRQQMAAHPELETHLRPVASQLGSISAVHGLQGAEGHDVICLCDMTTAICTNLQQVTGETIAPVVEVAVATPLQVSPAEAVPLALIINELVTNAVKHAACGNAHEPVTVRVEGDPQRATVAVHAPGAELPEGFDFDRGTGLGTGLTLVRSLMSSEGMHIAVNQLGGSVQARVTLWPPVVIDGSQENVDPVAHDQYSIGT